MSSVKDEFLKSLKAMSGSVRVMARMPAENEG